jgi:predicted DNA-binding protein YlxM (UPF0122 family)
MFSAQDKRDEIFQELNSIITDEDTVQQIKKTVRNLNEQI